MFVYHGIFCQFRLLIMKMHTKTIFLSILSTFTVFAQTNPLEKTKQLDNKNNLTTNVVFTSDVDTSFLSIQLEGAQYDGKRRNLPFFVLSHTTSYNQTALPIVKYTKTAVLNSEVAAIVRKRFSEFLRNDFFTEVIPSLCVDKNQNLVRLIPFRINAQNQVEELVRYEVSWQVTGNENSKLFKQASNFKTSSVLANGDWYKFGITKDGIHKIDKKFLEQLGVNTASLDPRQIQVYGNGGQMVPELNGSFRYDDLEENAIQVVGESDGEFNDQDYILFYGKGTNEWKEEPSGSGLKFEVAKNLYGDTSFYFLTVGSSNGKRITTSFSSQASPNRTTDAYDYYDYHEVNQVNFGKTGRAFYGEYFDIQTSYGFNWSDGDYVVGDSLMTRVSLAAAYTDTTQFLVSGNGFGFILTTPSLSVGSYLADYARLANKTAWTANTNQNAISLSVTKLTAKSVAWLDKITINARRKIKFNGKQFQFRDSRVVGIGNICRYTLGRSTQDSLIIWNVKDYINPLSQQYFESGNTVEFTSESNMLTEYAVGTIKTVYIPTRIGRIPNQNLHSIQQADYVIVTHPLFYNEALRLAAFHQKEEGYTTAVASSEEVYNEFGSGKQDISAIRDFIRMLYSRNLSSGKQVKYVLLIGDGSYVNSVRSTVNNSNYIPTYQSHESMSATSSLATDDFYGLMDANEGYYAEGAGSIDIGIGRFTCRSVTEVKGIISKIENYYRKDGTVDVATNDPKNCSISGESTMGDWRNNLLFVADDGDRAVHMKGADNLTTVLKTITTNYNSDKIYLDAYQRISTPGGQRYPDATEDFNRKIKKGVLLFNYTGHGGEVGLASERMLDIPTINAMDNFNKLPLFVTATCEFSRYDDPGRTSAGELCLTNPKGAAIALLTTVRLAYSSTNDLLNAVVMQKLFSAMPNGQRPTLGDVVRLTKSSPLLGGQLFYYANFHLLGDPAMPLVYPSYNVVTTKINNNAVTIASKDTLGALAKITVSGIIADSSGNKLSNFNGLVYSTVFDRQQDVVCLLNDPFSYDGVEGNPFKFKLQKNTLFRGKSKVTNGEFSFSFVVPKDISFSFGPGRISYYATDGLSDGNGSYDKLVVGGGSGNVIADNQGPTIDLFMNDKNFVVGSITNEKPVFYADVTDSSGINTLGTSFGHDITAVLNKSGGKPIILNDYYESDLNSYQSGRVRYPFDKLDEGDYQLNFKIWDIQNNSSVSSTEFVVANSAEMALTHVLNYPNPFNTRTTFMFEHNQACAPLKVSIQIYTISGKSVKTIRQSLSCQGFKFEGIDWDGRDDFGDKLARGVYIYRLSVISSENKKAEKIEKLVILN